MTLEKIEMFRQSSEKEMITTLWTTVNTDAVLINYAAARISNKQTV